MHKVTTYIAIVNVMYVNTIITTVWISETVVFLIRCTSKMFELVPIYQSKFKSPLGWDFSVFRIVQTVTPCYREA